MALKPCKECRELVSEWTSKCPNCGVNNPTVSLSQMMIGFGALIVATGLLVNGCSEKPKPTEAEAAQLAENAVSDEAACKQNIQCWYEHTMPGASFDCKEGIERNAKYDVKWSDSLMDPALTHAKWVDQEKGIIMLIGDKVRFQNGFGAWQPMIYSCTWDPATKTVLAVNVQEGRL